MRILFFLLMFLSQEFNQTSRTESETIKVTSCAVETSCEASCTIKSNTEKEHLDQLSDGGLLLTRLFTNS